MRRLLTAVLTAVVISSLLPLSVFALGPQTITWDLTGFTAKTYGDAPFDVSPYVAASSGLPVDLSSTTTGVCTIAGSTVTIVTAGTCSIDAQQPGGGGWDPADPVSQDFTIAKATVTVTATDRSITFGAADPAFTFTYGPFQYSDSSSVINTPPVCGVTGPHTGVAGSPYVISCSGGSDTSYAFSYVNGSLNIAKATPLVNAVGGTFLYNGSPHAGSGTATGVASENLTPVAIEYDGTGGTVYPLTGTAPTSVGIYRVTASYGGGANYNGAQGTAPLAITTASQTITWDLTGFTARTYGDGPFSVSPYASASSGLPVDFSSTTPSVCTTGGSHGATVTILRAGTCTIQAAQAGDADHGAAVPVPQDFTIARAAPNCTITGYSVTYNGAQHTATGTCLGVDGITVLAVPGLAGTHHTAAGSYPADPWTFTDISGNYNNTSGTVLDVINKANAVCTITPYAVPFDDTAHTATGSCVGTDGTTALDGLVLTGTTHTNAHSYIADPWSFTDATGNYNNDAGTITDVISKIDPVCTITPYSVIYDGASHTATGSCLALDGITALPVINLAGTVHTNAGDYSTDTWAFHDPAGNYNDKGGTSVDSIARADQVITYTSVAPNAPLTNDTYNPTATASSGLVVSFSIEPTSSASCSISGGTVTFLARGSCFIDAVQPGNANWNAAPTKQQIVGVMEPRPTCPDGAVDAVMHAATPGTITCADIEHDPLTYAVSSQGAHGTVVIAAATGAWTYTSNPGYVGTDTFQLTASDGIAESLAATITVTVTNNPVDAKDDPFTVRPIVASLVPLTTNDSAGVGDTGQPLTITAVTQGSKGRVTINGTTVTYDPIGCSTGSDFFTYTVSDGLTTDTATVIITIARPGQAVTAPAAATLSKNPVADYPSLWFVTGSTMGSTMPMRLAWCGLTASGSRVKAHLVYQSTNFGRSYGSSPIVSTTATSTVRNLAIGGRYAWRMRVVDSAGRVGSSGGATGDRLARYDDASASIHYSSGWSATRSSGYSGGTEHTATSAGASATLTLVGVRGFAIVGSKGTGRGSFRAYVDGVLVATISERTTSTHYRVVLLARLVTAGSHTIVIRPAGNGRIDLDAIVALT